MLLVTFAMAGLLRLTPRLSSTWRRGGGEEIIAEFLALLAEHSGETGMTVNRKWEHSRGPGVFFFFFLLFAFFHVFEWPVVTLPQPPWNIIIAAVIKSLYSGC